jgi:hypothetical protein
MSGQWINESPRGEFLPIDCKYPFSYGKSVWQMRDLPGHWTVVLLGPEDGRVKHFPTMGELAVPGVVFAFLVNPELEIVATWDEGRWWTPDESAAWLLMLQVPDTYVMAEGMRQQQMPRWWRRAQRRKRKGKP